MTRELLLRKRFWDALRCVARLAFLLVALVPLCPSLGLAKDWKAPREQLDRRVIHEEFRIHYTLLGEHGFPADVADSERAGQANARIGDLVDQLDRANRLYRERLRLTPPLDGVRYWDRGVRFIDLHILRLEGGKKGSTGDEPITYRYRHFEGGVPSLTISLTNLWKPPNLTPAHELFHAYQYGYTYFKNAWFLEGAARSIESAFKAKVPRVEPLPDSQTRMRQLMERSYDADVFWNRLFALCDPSCRSQAVAGRGDFFCGGDLLKGILEQYQVADKEAARTRGIRQNAWPEKEQRSKLNNPYLVLGLYRAMETQCRPLRDNPELKAFHSVLRQMLPAGVR